MTKEYPPPPPRTRFDTQADADGVATTATCWEHAHQWQYMTACEFILKQYGMMVECRAGSTVRCCATVKVFRFR